MLVQQEEQEVFMKKNLQLPTWNCQEKHISKIELTAANLELAGVGIFSKKELTAANLELAGVGVFSKKELTAANLELAGVGIQRVVVEVHPAGDGDADPAEYTEGM